MAVQVLALATELGMDESGFTGGLTSALTNVVAFGAGLGAVAIGAIAFFAEKEAQALDNTAKLSRELGISADALRAYELGAKIAGQETSGLETLMRKLPRSIGQANQGLMTQQRAFDDLSLDTDKLGILDAEEQFLQVADAIAQIESPTARAALAADIFGRAGQKFVPFLSQGRAGFAALREESDRLNDSFSDMDNAKIEEANDSAVRFGTAFDSIFKQVALVVAPAKENVFNFITDLVVGFRENALPGIIDFVQNGLGLLRDFIIENGPIVGLWARTYISWFKLLGLGVMNFVIEPLFSLASTIGEVLGFGGSSFKDFTGTVTELMIGLKFVFENFEGFVDLAIDGALFHVTKFAEELSFFFLDDLPKIIVFFGEFMFATLNNTFFSILSLMGGFIEQSFAIFANLDQLLLGKISLKDILTSSEGLFDDAQIELPELLLNTRQEGFQEQLLREQFERSKNEMGISFEQFRKDELAKLDQDSNFLEDFFKMFTADSGASVRESGGLGGDRSIDGGGAGKSVTEAVERGSAKDFEIIQRTQDQASTAADKQLEAQIETKEAIDLGNTIAFDTQKFIEDLEPVQIGTFQ